MLRSAVNILGQPRNIVRITYASRACVIRRYATSENGEGDEKDFVDPKAKAEYEEIMQMIESTRQGTKITRPTLQKPRHIQRLRSTGAVGAVAPSVKSLQDGLSGSDESLDDLQNPTGSAQQLLPELPCLGVIRTATATIPSHNLEEALRVYRDMVGPAYKRTDGFKGASLSLNRELRTMHSITFWASQHALEQNNVNPMYQNAMKTFSKLVSDAPRVETLQMCCEVAEDIHF